MSGARATLWVLVLASAAPVWAAAAPDAGTVEPPALTEKLSTDRVQLGEPFIFEITVKHAPRERYELKAPANVDPFEILEIQRHRSDSAESATTTFAVKMSLFDLGVHRIPDLELDVFTESAVARASAPGREVEGVSALPEDAKDQEAQLEDIRGPENVPIRTYRLLVAVLGLLAAVALGALLFRWMKKPRVQRQPAAPPLPLDLRTLLALDALRAEDLPGKGRIRDFHFRLSEILREYLGARYGFDALECTGGELLEQIRKRPTPGLSLLELTRFIEMSELVKFAKLQATAGECKEALELCYRFVRETTLPPPLPSDASPKTDAQRFHVP